MQITIREAPENRQPGALRAKAAGVAVAAKLSILVPVLALAGACGTTPPGPLRASGPDAHTGSRSGYLPQSALPDSLHLLAPPPGRGTPRMAADVAVNRRAQRLRGTARWALARRDAVLSFPRAAAAFRCAVGFRITRDGTPNLYSILRRTGIDARRATHRAKRHYRRARPFLLNRQPICTPEEAKRLSKEGSFPSGHAATGWAWALVLSELVPDRADAILLRGRQFGESRLVCNVHWYSDVLAGRMVGSAVVSRLHGDRSFRAAMRAARREVAAARRRAPATGPACRRKAAVLGRTDLYGR